MEQYQRLHGLVLRCKDYKEADQLVTLYTREQGKITVQAKGVKRTSSKLRAGLLLFSQTEVVLTAGKGFPIVTGAVTETAFAQLRNDVMRMAYASYVAEVFDQVMGEGQPDDGQFLLLLQTFYLLEQLEPWLAARFFEERLLYQQGHGLELGRCQYCGNPIRGEQHRGVLGGLLCSHCRLEEPSDLHLMEEGRTLLRAIQQLPPHQLMLVHGSKAGQRSLEHYMEFQMQQLLSWPLKSKAFLKQLSL